MFGKKMAQSISKKELKIIPKTDYESIRSSLKTGDLFFCSGGYLFSGIIQHLTKSIWSHVAIIYKDEELGRVLVLEAEPYIGIRLIPLSNYLKNYKGRHLSYKGQIIITQMNEPIERKQLNKAISFGLDELTRPYDNWEIIRIMTRILFRIGKRTKNKSYICSELVSDAYAKANIFFKFRNSYISPQQIWEDERVALKYRIL
jgi:hypothetical protein